MKKNLLSLAVIAALAAPVVAVAQGSGITIYGRANLGLDSYSATGATAGSAFDYKSRNRIYDAGSRLGFMGTEDLGGGLKAIFLIESGVNIDSGGTTGQSGSPNANSGTLSSRVGHVGLESSSWGRLTFGRSHVWWGNGIIEQTGANYIAAGVPLFNGLFGRGMQVGISRESNTIQYSALKGGTAVQISYSAGGETQVANANTDGKLWALTLQQQLGTFMAGYDFAKKWGNSPAVPFAPATAALCATAVPAAGGGTAPAVPTALCSQPSSTAHKLRAGWFYQPGGQISVLWVKSVQDNGGATAILTAQGSAALALVPDTYASSLSQTGWGLSWEHMFGNVQALAQWGKLGNISGCTGRVVGACNNTGATSWMVAGRYIFSKRTAMYVNYATVKNDSNYNMDYIGGWMTSASTTLPAALGGTNIGPGLLPANVGADPRLFGVGVMHNF